MNDRMLESELEMALIDKLVELKYDFRSDIRDRASLEGNFRKKFEDLNQITLTDREFQRLLDEIITPDVYEASRLLRNRESFIRDDGTQLNYTLVNIKDWCKNTFEVVRQLRINSGNSHHRYDALLLINGVPVVQIELKTLGVSPRRALEQVVKYKNDPGNGYSNTLLSFVQLFIVSNRTDTWYFTNNNSRHFAFDAEERFLPIYQFADEENIKLSHLEEFSDRFLAKCNLGEMISRYMVLIASERKLLMMRPYQIYAVKAIVDCIKQNSGNGYIWHTTGSGKTLTSFKAATLLKSFESIHKCLFVVDRKDLDRQTREEFNRFQANCVEENTNTAALVSRLLSDDYADKVIVTTIQKLGLALDEYRGGKLGIGAQSLGPPQNHQLEHLRDKKFVFIFDECHRSQFGENHRAIKEFFPNSQLFGFTGTPIFEENASLKQVQGGVARLRTTKDLFQEELHAYTITHAIEDRNVLRFHVDFYRSKDDSVVPPGHVLGKQAVVNAVLAKHDAATAGRRFNALLATASIQDAIEYYELFKETQSKRIAEDHEFVPLRVAAVFSPPAEGNKDVQQIQEDLPQEKEDNRHEPEYKKRALQTIIADYNQQYQTKFGLEGFDLYFQDVQQRIKDHQFSDAELPRKGAEKIDVTIVVDMLLTGFDARYLNTLYVDKNLKYHGLIQAFSRTNRVLNATKPYGHILDFRQQQANVDDAIALFSGARHGQARSIWLVDEAATLVEQFREAVGNLNELLESQGLEASPDQVTNLRGDEARIRFINKYKEVQRIQTQLDQYTDLSDQERLQIEQVLTRDDARAYRGAYLEIAQRLREQLGTANGHGSLAELAIDNLDFEFVLFASALIDYDYIVKLISTLTRGDPERFKISRDQLIGLIQSDAKFLDERDDISAYVLSLKGGESLDEASVWSGYERFKAERRAHLISGLALAHGLSADSLQSFVKSVLQRRVFDGEKLTDIMLPLNLGWRERRTKELSLMADLAPILRRMAHGREISGLSAYEQMGTQ